MKELLSKKDLKTNSKNLKALKSLPKVYWKRTFTNTYNKWENKLTK